MLEFLTQQEMDWATDPEYLAAELAADTASAAATNLEEEQVRLLRALQPSDGMRRTEPLSPRYLFAKERADDARRAADEAEAARVAAEQTAKARALPLWLDELRERFAVVADRMEALAEAFGALEAFADRANVARMQIVDLRIGSGAVNRDGLRHWLQFSRAAIDQQLARKI